MTRIAERRDALTGTSEFPNLKEDATAVLHVKPVELPAYGGGAIHSQFEPLAPKRLAAPFEALRDKSDDILQTTGQRPRIFLANLGTPADFIPRAQFARSFFEAGGIEALDSQGFSNADDLAAAFKASGARLACLCATDKIYAERAEEAAAALAAAGATAIYLAGRPGGLKERYSKAGISEFIFAGCNALATLGGAYDRMK
jgi:methylmalonyl-CoA mutase